MKTEEIIELFRQFESIANENAGQEAAYHFADVSKMIDLREFGIRSVGMKNGRHPLVETQNFASPLQGLANYRCLRDAKFCV